MENSKQARDGAVRDHLNCFLTALTFLTILPIRFYGEEGKNYFSTALYYFPLVGSIIGLLVCMLLYPLSFFLPKLVVTAVALLLFAGISGFLHFDGLSDSFDGLFSSRDREKSLAIMRDSRIGAMGLAGVLFVMLIKFSALISIAPDYLFQTVFLIPIAGRVATVVAMATQKYARKEGGLGQLFFSAESKKAAILSLVLLFFITALITSYLVSVVLVSSVILSVLLFGLLCKARLGGATGDTLGATCELTEMITVVVFSSFFAMG